LGLIGWKKWASINGISSVDILPAKPFFVAIYLSSLVQSCRTVSPVTQAFYSLQWAHNLIGQPSSTDTYLVKNVLEGAKRKLTTPTRQFLYVGFESLEKYMYKNKTFLNT
jgi:hypothetical protein